MKINSERSNDRINENEEEIISSLNNGNGYNNACNNSNLKLVSACEIYNAKQCKAHC